MIIYLVYDRQWVPHFIQRSIQRRSLLFTWVNVKFFANDCQNSKLTLQLISFLDSQRYLQLHQIRKLLWHILNEIIFTEQN
jgi:hypothetical protein